MRIRPKLFCATYRRMKTALFILVLSLAPFGAGAEPQPVEVHTRLTAPFAADKKIALTLDACSGKYDDDLIAFLVEHRIPATIFATRKWLDKNPHGLAVIKAHLDLFDVENHGEKHIPAIIGTDRSVYGIPGEPDVAHLRREVVEGARAVEKATGIAPHWYRDATGEYDPQAIQEIDKLGYRIAGFSVNVDQGATASKAAIEQRLKKVVPGDVIIAHMNKPASDSAEGLAAGLPSLLKAGFVFVRLDQADLQVIPGKASKKSP